MQTTVLQENFKKALSFVSKVISTKTQLPVLSHILLNATAGKIQISASNLETSISFWIGAAVEKEGAVTVPARLLTETVNSFSQEKINLKAEKNSLILESGESKATLNGMDASEFPTLPGMPEKTDATLKKEVLEKSVPFVLVAASNDEGRPLLTGVNVLIKNDQVILAATDGYRLSVKELPHVSGIEEGMVLPARAFDEAFKAMLDESADGIGISLSKDKNQIIFLLPRIQISTRLIEGEYPPYEKIIPTSFVTRTVFNREEMLPAARFVSVLAKETANIIKFLVSPGKISLFANSPQLGENKTAIAAKVEGEGGEIAFNARFLLDLLAVFPEEEVVFEMNGPLSPGVFRPLSDQSYLHIIMPVRVQE